MKIVERIQQALEKVRSPESLESIRKLGAEPVVSTPEVLRAKIDEEIKSYAKLIKDTGISVD